MKEDRKEEKKEVRNDRRKFVRNMGMAVGATAFSAPLFSFFAAEGAGKTEAEAKKQRGQNAKLGIALMGLGQYSANQLAPALQETENCYLAGIITGTPSKVEQWQEKYDIPDENVYNYDNFEEIANNDAIDIIYVVLPNALHAEYVVRSAKTGKDIICEKPMATSVEDAERMLQACRENGVRLAIGYRLHFEPFHQRTMELGQGEVFGKVQRIEAFDSNDMTDGNLDVWRLNRELAGGGPLLDLGIYCVQAAIYNTGKKPVAVTAEFGEVTKPAYFYDVEQSINWQMEFDDGTVADCESSYAEAKDSLFVEAERGFWHLEPSFGYDGKEGRTSEGPMDLPNITEQVRQMDSQAASFRNNEESKTPGEMGLRDVKILMAIYESARNNGERVEIQY